METGHNKPLRPVLAYASSRGFLLIKPNCTASVSSDGNAATPCFVTAFAGVGVGAWLQGKVGAAGGTATRRSGFVVTGDTGCSAVASNGYGATSQIRRDPEHGFTGSIGICGRGKLNFIAGVGSYGNSAIPAEAVTFSCVRIAACT